MDDEPVVPRPCSRRQDNRKWELRARPGWASHSQIETLWNVRPHQSVLAPENLTTLPHFSVSSAISLPKSAGEPASTVPPRSASRAFMLGSARPALISLLSLSTISTGVFFGAPIPIQLVAS